MKYRCDNINGVTVLRLSGEMGRGEARQVQQMLEAFMKAGQFRVVLDLEEVIYLERQAIITLLRLNREAIGSGGEIKPLRPRQVVNRFIDIGRVLELFERYETKVVAIRSFRK